MFLIRMNSVLFTCISTYQIQVQFKVKIHLKNRADHFKKSDGGEIKLTTAIFLCEQQSMGGVLFKK